VNRLEELGITKCVHKTRLKNSILEYFQGALEQSDGKNTIIVFNEGMKNMLKEALKERDFSDDAVTLAKAATIVRKDTFSHEAYGFSGHFPPQCQENPIPSSLKSLISMILRGTTIKDQERGDSQACLTIGQMILFNSKKRVSESSTSKTRHTTQREPPLPLYIGINIHASTRSKKLITQLYQLGICVSYERIMEIEDWIATSVSERFEEDGFVAPAGLRKGIFSVGALDNIDHNPSSTTSQSSFHGTGISILQFPTEDNPGEHRPPIVLPPTGNQRQFIPESYATVPAVALTPSSVEVPECNMKTSTSRLADAKTQENCWMEHARQRLSKTELCSEDAIAWAAYHSSMQLPGSDPPALTSLLPLFYEKAATPAMIKHGMNVLRQAITFLNPAQIPVITFDQPLFAIAKFIQWKWPTTHGERVYVVMFGGLHIEMALWSTVGDLLEGSGWTTALIEAEVASSGIAESFLKVSHLTRTR